jgi:hypothetical protein
VTTTEVVTSGDIGPSERLHLATAEAVATVEKMLSPALFPHLVLHSLKTETDWKELIATAGWVMVSKALLELNGPSVSYDRAIVQLGQMREKQQILNRLTAEAGRSIGQRMTT